MLMLTGPQVHAAITPFDDELGEAVPEADATLQNPSEAMRRLQERVARAAANRRAIQRFRLSDRIVELERDAGDPLTVVNTYTTAERYRGSTGQVGAIWALSCCGRARSPTRSRPRRGSRACCATGLSAQATPSTGSESLRT
jgi:hypothetical protein